MTTVGSRNSGPQKAIDLLAELIPEHADAIQEDAALATAIADAQRSMGSRPETIAYVVGLEAIPDGYPPIPVLIGRCQSISQQAETAPSATKAALAPRRSSRAAAEPARGSARPASGRAAAAAPGRRGARPRGPGGGARSSAIGTTWTSWLRGPRRRIALLVAVGVLAAGAVVLVPWSRDSGETKAVGGSSASPSVSVSPSGRAGVAPGRVQFFVNPSGSAASWVRNSPADPRVARVADSIASKSVAQWFSGADPGAVGRYVQAARKAGQVPVVVSFQLPDQSCEGGGGLPSAVAYRQWVEELATAVDGGPAVVLLEPYSMVTLGCASDKVTKERFVLLGEAVTRLSASPQVGVYLDGGGVASDPVEIADRLRRAGVAKARGFAVNVAETAPTAAATRYADQVSARLRTAGVDRGFRYVVDTSRSGGTQLPPKEYVCNPSWARAGEDPVPLTGSGAADAYVWTKTPGESDGECGGSTVAQFVFDPMLAERLLG
jgi:endoglucanase